MKAGFWVGDYTAALMSATAILAPSPRAGDRGRADDRPVPGRGDDPDAGLDVAIRRVDRKGPRAEREHRSLVPALGDLPLPRRVRRGIRAGRRRVDPPRACRRGHRSGGDAESPRRSAWRNGAPPGGSTRSCAPRRTPVLCGAGARREGALPRPAPACPRNGLPRWTIPSTAAWTSTGRAEACRKAREGSSGARNPWGGTTNGSSGSAGDDRRGDGGARRRKVIGKWADLPGARPPRGSTP